MKIGTRSLHEGSSYAVYVQNTTLPINSVTALNRTFSLRGFRLQNYLQNWEPYRLLGEYINPSQDHRRAHIRAGFQHVNTPLVQQVRPLRSAQYFVINAFNLKSQSTKWLFCVMKRCFFAWEFIPNK
jgi:hypothetical protein